MCVCVFGIHLLKIAVEKWFWEVNMVFGSLVELLTWLHSCLCFSLLEKLFLKVSSTPSYLSSFQAFSYRNLDASSTLGGLIEKVPVPLIASRHLVDRSSLISCVWCFVPRHLLDTCISRRLNPRHLPRHLSRHLHLLRFTEALYILLMRSEPHFPQSLSW